MAPHAYFQLELGCTSFFISVSLCSYFPFGMNVLSAPSYSCPCFQGVSDWHLSSLIFSFKCLTRSIFTTQVLQLKMLVVPVAPDNSDTDSNASDTEGNDGPDDLTMDPVIPYWHFFNTCHVMLTLMSGGGGGGSSIHATLSSNVLSGQERRHQPFSIPAFKVKKD